MDAREAEVRELAAVVALFRELGRIGALAGMRAQMRDAVPRMELVTSTGVVVDVRVDLRAAEGCGAFVFRPSFGRHPVDDVPGAARALVAVFRACGHRPAGSGGLR